MPKSGRENFWKLHALFEVDNDFSTTGIIDWEIATAEAKDFTISSSCMMWPVEDYYDGLNNLAEDETEFAHISKPVGVRIPWRFS